MGIHKSQIVKKSVILYENACSVSKINLLRANALAKNFANP